MEGGGGCEGEVRCQEIMKEGETAEGSRGAFLGGVGKWKEEEAVKER